MNVIPGAMVSLLASLSVNIEAQSFVEALHLNPRDVSAGIAKTAGFVIPGQETDQKPLSIEVGDIVLRDGTKARSIILHGSSDPYGLSDPLPGLDQALAGCDGNQAQGWVSYTSVTITCTQGGVQTTRSIPLPPSTQDALSLVMQSKGGGSRMLIAKDRDTARLVVDSSVLTAATRLLSTIQFGSPFANHSYTVGDVRHVKDNDGRGRLMVDLSLVDEVDLNQPATDGNSSSRKKKNKGGKGKADKEPSSGRDSTGQGEDSEGGEKPGDGGGYNPPGGNGGDDREPDKGPDKNKLDTVQILSISVPLEQLLKALQTLLNSATDAQKITLSGLVGLLLEQINKPEDATSIDYMDEQKLPELIADILQRSELLIQNAEGDSASTVRGVLTSMLNGLGSGETINNVMQTLHNQNYRDLLRRAHSSSSSQNESDEASTETVAGSTASTSGDSDQFIQLMSQMLSALLEINIPSENSDSVPDEMTQPEAEQHSEAETKVAEATTSGGKENNPTETGKAPVTILNPNT